MNIQTRQPNVFVPVLMQEIAGDARQQAFLAALPDQLRARLRQRWNNLPPPLMRQLYGAPRRRPAGASFVAELIGAARAFESTRASQVASKQELVRREVERALTGGVGRYQPSAALAGSPDLSLLVQQRLQELLEKDCCSDDDAEAPAPAPRYSVKAKRVRCKMKDESSAHDEVYLVTTAVPGNGPVVVGRSRLMSMNAGDDDRTSPNHYVYPPGDAGGFLDVAIALWEDDGGYEAVGEALVGIGEAVQTIPDPRAIGAGAVLQIVGGLLTLAAILDGDDHYGSGHKAWSTQNQLETGTGTRSFQYYNPDTGIWDTSGWHYFVDYELRAHPQ